MTTTESGGTKTYTLHASYNQLKDAIDSGYLPVILDPEYGNYSEARGIYEFFGIHANANVYGAWIGSHDFFANSADSFLVYEDGGRE